MDDDSPGPGAGSFTEITVRVPDELARLLGAGEVERRVLEALALDEFLQGNLTRPELGRVLGFETPARLDAFLAAHDAVAPPDALDRARRARGRQAAANIIARRKGVTLGGLSIKDLINEGRP